LSGVPPSGVPGLVKLPLSRPKKNRDGGKAA
jgi:hypothetical protein